MPLNTLLVCDDQTSVGQIHELIAEEPSLTLIDTVSSDQAVAQIARIVPELVWVDLHTSPVRGLAVIAQLRESNPEISVLTSYGTLDAELVRTAYRLGACDILESGSWKTELAPTLKRVEGRRALSVVSGQKPYVITGPVDKDHPLTVLLVCDAGKEKLLAIEGLLKEKKQLRLFATVSIADALAKARFLSPKLIWIELSPNPDRALALLADLKQNLPKTNIFVSYDVPDAQLIRDSYRLGASDFLDAERWKTDFGAALKAILPRQKQTTLPLFLVVALLMLVVLALALFILHR